MKGGKSSKAVCAAFLAVIVVISTHPALACSYSQAPETVGQTSAEYFAKIMVDAATSVDLVLLEYDGTRPLGAAETGILTIRTVARLKGNSADRFSLFGTGLTLKPDADRLLAAPLQHFTSETGQVTPFAYNEERPRRLFPATDVPPPPLSLTSCSPPEIAGHTGRFYVVMRGTDGRLLNRFAYRSDAGISQNLPAFAFVPVTLERDDIWLRAVSMAASASAARAGNGATLLQVRASTDPRAIELAMRNSGATIRAAYFELGGRIDEVRPSDEEARRPWLAKAVDMERQRGRGGLGDPDHGAAEYLRWKLGPMQRYGGLGYEVAQAFIATMPDKAAAAKAVPRLIALEIDRDPATFAGQSFYAGVMKRDRNSGGLPSIAGDTDAAQFATLQRIERDIWLLNGGNGNPQGTLPRQNPLGSLPTP